MVTNSVFLHISLPLRRGSFVKSHPLQIIADISFLLHGPVDLQHEKYPELPRRIYICGLSATSNTSPDIGLAVIILDRVIITSSV